MAASKIVFEEWLRTKLQDLNTDHEVFGGYITGILDSDDSNEEKLEALEGILVEVSADSITSLCKDILCKWSLQDNLTADNAKARADVDAKLATIMEQQAQSVGPGKRVSEVDKKSRDAILAQYSQVSDAEEDGNDDPGGGAECAASSAAAGTSSSGDTLMFRNTNSEAVTKAEKERRDKAKADTVLKKAQDKAGREKQKQQQQERKEKEKKRTQKGERKR